MSIISLCSILESSRMVGANYDDWYRNLRIVLMHEKLLNIIDGPTMVAPLDPYNSEVTKMYEKYKEGCLNNKWIILTSMSSKLQRQHQDMDPTVIVEHLKKMYDGQSRTTRYLLSKMFIRSSMPTKDQVGPQVLMIIELFEQLEKLEFKLEKEISQDLNL
ncbi:PREDICTED: uncharacterized protein LOC109334023 [Lupinus angustifolius]|uniref:uncharacterized protein LOC109334023 n=1 Tax=Lupinus angustifolius TaxID=3871 RepID=UPI00092E405D|nr:PREDICTED: uncharacterized protein LOC109334023 [Lupinus angustifolius]